MASIKILLAEDDGDDRTFFYDFLKERKDIVLLPPAENGVEVFHYLEKVDTSAYPDAIILDQNMPKRNGLQTLQLLKSTNRFSKIPVVVYSTYTDENLIQESLRSGATLVCPKPVTSEGYNNMINVLLEKITAPE